MYKTAKDLDSAIKTVIVNSANLRKEIQDVSIGICVFAAGKGSGNVTRAKTLVDGLGDGVRRDSLVEWFAIVGINFSEEGEVSLDKSMLNTENLNKAKALNWWEVKKAPSPFKSLSYADMLAQSLKGMYKQYVEGQKDGNDCLLKLKEITAFEKFVQKEIGAAAMPKRPDILKTKVVAGDANKGAVSAAA